MPEDFPVRSEEYLVGPLLTATGASGGWNLQRQDGREEWRICLAALESIETGHVVALT
jgi:hypothetical protein